MVNFGLLTAEICQRVSGTPANFNTFHVLAALLHAVHDTLVVGVSQTAAINRGRYLYSAGRPSRWALAHILVTGSLARSASRRYLIYSEADFEVFRPAGATRCTDGDEVWHGGGDRISPPSVHRLGYRTPKLKYLLRFDQNVEYERPAVAYPCAIFTKFTEIVPRFRMR